MEEQATESRTYELAYHITPDLDEAAAQTLARELESLIVKNGGESVMASREPKKIHLSYPLMHKYYAHFGVINFNAPTESLVNINAQMRLEKNILRFLVISKQTGKKETRTLGDQRNRRARINVAPTHKKIVGEGITPTKQVTPGEEKEIEKELEDVLEKIS